MPDPALVFESGAPPTDPGTHVLLIGIGTYPWLLGGEHCTSQAAQRRAMGMKQLGSPPASMRAMANWFLDDFGNDDHPLASLAMLLSEPEPAVYNHANANAVNGPLPQGNIDEIGDAITAWLDRASDHTDNMVILAFCGHGVQSNSPVLLARDYGSNAHNRFDGAINLEALRIALLTKQPEYQLLFMDACRTPDMVDDLLGRVDVGRNLASRDPLSDRGGSPAKQSVHFATSLYSKAWGRTEAESLFTGALLEGLSGGAADSQDEWFVTTSFLNHALGHYLHRISEQEGIVQAPQAFTQPFRIARTQSITVPVHISASDDTIWQEEVVFKACRDAQCELEHRYIPPNDPALRQAVRDCTVRISKTSMLPTELLYDMSAHFDPGSAFSDTSAQVLAMPPQATCNLPITPRGEE